MTPPYVSSQRDEVVRRLDNLIYDVTTVNGVSRLTDRCKEFRKYLNSYNSPLAWASEGVDIIDHGVGHYDFRMQGQMRHCIGPLIPREGEDPKFAMICCVNSSQEQLDYRLLRNSHLHRDTLHGLQSALNTCNPFANALQTCLERQQQHPHPYQARLILKQMEPRRLERGTHNRPTANEVATVVSGLDDLNGTNHVERNIVVETRDGALQRIPYWHSCYMPLRYPLIFPYGEASWQQNTRMGSINLPEDHLLGLRSSPLRAGRVYNHGQRYEADAPPVPEEHDREVAVETAPVGQVQWING